MGNSYRKRNSTDGYRFFPHRVKGEGFFLAALRKIDHQSEGKLNSRSSLSRKRRKKSKTSFSNGP